MLDPVEELFIGDNPDWKAVNARTGGDVQVWNYHSVALVPNLGKR